MKKVSKFIILTFIVGGLLIARSGKSNTRVEQKNTHQKSEHYWVQYHSDKDNDQLDRKRSHKRRRKVRRPVKGLR